jgi:hypothetical protein
MVPSPSIFLGANGVPVLKMLEYRVVDKSLLLSVSFPLSESSGNLYADIYRDPIRLVVVWFNMSVDDYLNLARPGPTVCLGCGSRPEC